MTLNEVIFRVFKKSESTECGSGWWHFITIFTTTFKIRIMERGSGYLALSHPLFNSLSPFSFSALRLISLRLLRFQPYVSNSLSSFPSLPSSVLPSSSSPFHVFYLHPQGFLTLLISLQVFSNATLHLSRPLLHLHLIVCLFLCFWLSVSVCLSLFISLLHTHFPSLSLHFAFSFYYLIFCVSISVSGYVSVCL